MNGIDFFALLLACALFALLLLTPGRQLTALPCIDPADVSRPVVPLNMHVSRPLLVGV